MRYIALIAMLCLAAVPAAAQFTCSYSWEDGGTILGSYGNAVDPTNVTGVQNGQAGDQGTWSCPGAYDGQYYLHVAEEPHYSTPQVYVAWITGLTAGDIVSADFWVWDNIDVGYPSGRIWAHYATDADIDDYQGSAGQGTGTGDYTSGIGWENVSSSWEFGNPAGFGGEQSLVIEFRLYSSPTSGEARTDYWCDMITITAPTTACVVYPEASSPVEDATWTNIKDLYR